MKKTVIINMSPRQNGTSNMVASMVKDYQVSHGHPVEHFNLYTNLQNKEKLFKSIDQADTVVMCGPSYINSYPADTIALLQDIMKHKEIIHGQNLYGIIQGGMPYMHSHASGIKSLELFCRESGMQFKGGFVFGLGPILNGRPLNNLPNGKSVIRQFNIFLSHIDKGELSPNTVYEKARLRLPSILYKLMARSMNKKINKDLEEHGIDYRQQSPYFQD